MTKITRILGTAGAGKTKECIDTAHKEVDNGIDPDDIVYLSFTRAAAQEAKGRISDRLDIPEYELGNNWRNLHSMCFKLLGLSRSNVATSYERKQFCEDLGLIYSIDISEYQSIELNRGEDATGNRIFSAYDWLKSRNENISEGDIRLEKMFDLKQQDINVNPYQIMRTWSAYKKRHDLVDFSDMLYGVLRLNRVPDAKVLIWDEFQDTSPLDYEVYKLWKKNMDRVYISGCPTQSIFGFRGSSPKFIEDEKSDDDTFLDISYRVPENIWREADKIRQQMDNITKYKVTPKKKGGEFRIKKETTDMSQLEERVMEELYGDAQRLKKIIADGFNGMDLIAEVDTATEEDDSVMAIFRTRLCSIDFQNRLLRVGIPYSCLRKDSNVEVWTRQVFNLRNGIRDLKLRGDTTGVKKRAINKLLDDSIWEESKDDVVDESIKIIEDKSQIDRDYNDRTILAKEYPLNYYQALALIKNLEHDRLELSPYDVRVGTKHTAKGKEADVVITSFDTSWKILDNHYFPKGDLITDEERRVDFVALTRAKKRVVIQESAWKNIPFHSLKALKGIWR